MSDYLQPHGLKHRLPKFAQTHVHWVRDAIQPSHPLLPLLLLSSVFPSIRVFFKESALHIRWPKYWSFSFSIIPSNEYSRLISFRIDWYDLLAVQGTLKSLLQHHNLKTSILQPYSWPSSHIHTWLQGKTIALTIWNFIRKVMSLLFDTLSMFVIAFSKELASFDFMTGVTIQSDFGAWKNKVCHCFQFVTVCLPWSKGTGCYDLSFLNVGFRPAFSFSSFTFIKRVFSSSSLSAIRVVSSAYLRLLIFLQAILIPAACDSSSLTFCMIFSAYMLNKQGDNIQPWCIPFPIWNQSVVPSPVLTVASWPTYRFLRRQVRWSGSAISKRIFHSLLWSTQSKALA